MKIWILGERHPPPVSLLRLWDSALPVGSEIVRKHKERVTRVRWFPSDNCFFQCASQDIFSFPLQKGSGTVSDRHVKDFSWVLFPLPLLLSLCDFHCRWSLTSLEVMTLLWMAYACIVRMTRQPLSPWWGSKWHSGFSPVCHAPAQKTPKWCHHLLGSLLSNLLYTQWCSIVN